MSSKKSENPKKKFIPRSIVVESVIEKLWMKLTYNISRFYDAERSCSRGTEASLLLIPGLANDVAVKCLARVSRSYHREMKGVCSSWRALITDTNSFLYVERYEQGLSEPSILSMSFPRLSNHLVVEVQEVHLRTGITRTWKHEQQNLKTEGPNCDCRDWNYTVVWQGSDSHEVAILGTRRSRWDWHKACWNPFYRMDLVSGRIRKAASMLQPFRQLHYAVLNGELYVLNTHLHENEELTTTPQQMQRYNFCTDSWNFVAAQQPLPGSLMIIRLSAVSGRLLLQGYNYATLKYNTMSYSPQLQSWQLECEMNDGSFQWDLSRLGYPPGGASSRVFGIRRTQVDQQMMFPVVQSEIGFSETVNFCPAKPEFRTVCMLKLPYRDFSVISVNNDEVAILISDPFQHGSPTVLYCRQHPQQVHWVYVPYGPRAIVCF